MGFCCSWEDDLIAPEKWDELYKDMPKYCQEVVDICREEPDCIGIGRNEELGWFVAGAGQGPCLMWSEHEEAKKSIE
jgi:hypothetical protein